MRWSYDICDSGRHALLVGNASRVFVGLDDLQEVIQVRHLPLSLDFEAMQRHECWYQRGDFSNRHCICTYDMNGVIRSVNPAIALNRPKNRAMTGTALASLLRGACA